MVKPLDPDARRQVLSAAVAEARRRGDRRLGTDHLLLGLLDDPTSLATRVLGVDLAAARAAFDDLDRAALAAVGIEVGPLPPGPPPGRAGRRLPMTSGARAALARAVRQAVARGARAIGEAHLLLAVLDLRPPDPAAMLLARLGVDPAAARARLGREAA